MIPLNIINMAAEALSGHNDGWTQKAYKEQLKAIRDYINQILREA